MLADWGLTGRRAVHLEYCEYQTVQARDASGALRPKCVEVTTEFSRVLDRGCSRQTAGWAG